MDLFEAIYKRRSVRSFKSDLVCDNLIKKILNAAIMAPTGGNMQPWEFFVIRDPKIKSRITKTTYTGYSMAGKSQSWLQEAPVIILVCIDQKRTGARYGREGKEVISLLDVACAVENMLLSATALGLGSCWVAGFDKEEVKKILHIDNTLKPIGLIPIGYPHHLPTAPYRLSIEYVVHFI